MNYFGGECYENMMIYEIFEGGKILWKCFMEMFYGNTLWNILWNVLWIYLLYLEIMVGNLLNLGMLKYFVMSTPCDTQTYIYIYIYGIMICGYLDDGDSVLADDILIYGRPGLCLIHLCYAWDAKIV